MRGPSVRRSTGSRTRLTSSEKATTTTPPRAIDRMTFSGTMNSVPSASSTVTPEARTVSPEVRSVTARGVVDGPAGGQLLLEPADDEQRVVHADAQPEHGGGVLHEDGQLDVLGQHRQHAGGEGDRAGGDDERAQRGGHPSVEEQQDEQQQRQRHELGVLESLLAQGVASPQNAASLTRLTDIPGGAFSLSRSCTDGRTRRAVPSSSSRASSWIAVRPSRPRKALRLSPVRSA
jgi:hypothetical protein